MSTIKTILKEENERLQKLLKRYEEEIAGLPTGSISIKARRDRKYAYRAYRESGKVITRYVGPVNSDAVNNLQEQIKRRKELEVLHKTTRERIAELRKAMK